MSDLESEVVSELNFARMQPSEYADYLIAYSELFVGRELRERGEVTVLTNEGVRAVNEAIRFLRSQKPLPYLTASNGMSKGALDMVRMQETTTQIGHKGRDGSTFADRISRYGTWEGSCSENIDYGNNTARRIVMALIIDDGVSNRGHRKSIFNPGFKRVGVACGQHQKFRYMCVIEFAVGYTEK
ncbi:MAG TPA: CAP domain-containing protein [Prolixibacteraceae bacterium]